MRFLNKLSIIPLFIFALFLGFDAASAFAAQGNALNISVSHDNAIQHHHGGGHHGGHGPHGGCWR